ncbi:MAG: hydrogenase iron-sulfur subunit [Spirochaetales bacterium]|nr:hydrogenase iron-sulfur subunit [Spirochaetales bacterium]
MIKHECSDAIVYICHNCIPEAESVVRQWTQEGVHVQVRTLPCTGKINTQYIFHALEGGCRGVCVVACPPGECKLSQGNYRAQMRVNTVKRLLDEIGLEPQRAELIHFSKDEKREDLDRLLSEVISRFSSLGESPVLLKKEAEAVN